MIEELAHRPDLYLDEMQWFLAETCDIHVAESTICEHLKRANYTHKIAQINAAQRDEGQRAFYLYQISEFTSDMFVFVDESGVDKRATHRRYGWAPKGQPPIVSKLLKRGTRFNLLPAITVDGIIDNFVYQGSTNLIGFTEWLRDRILPQMSPFPGPRSVLVMDNATFHHSQEIYDLVESFGVKLQYLPPYSPDFNPIEAWLGLLKKLMRRQGRWKIGDFSTEDDFASFLSSCADEAGQQKDQIRGFFKRSRAGCDLLVQ